MANAVDFNSSGLTTMLVSGIFFLIMEPFILFALCATTNDKKVSKGTNYMCAAFVVGSL